MKSKNQYPNLCKLLTVACFLFVNLFANGQIFWQNSIGGAQDDLLNNSRLTSDGGYILAGTSYSGLSGEKTENAVGSSDFWIVKLDSVGVLEWQNTIGGTNVELVANIVQTTDGGYFVGGTSASDSSGDKNENSMGLADYWVLKLDNLGNIQWQNTIGGSLSDYLLHVEQCVDGGYILGGNSYSDIGGDKTENSVSASLDYWMVKLDTSGNIEWQNTIGGDQEDYLTCIQQTSDGGFVLSGNSRSGISGDKSEAMVGGYNDFWVVRTDSLGNIEWQNTIGGTDEDDAHDIKQTPDGGFILVGESLSNLGGDKSENSNGDFDYWVLKLDSLGGIEWQNTIGGDMADKLNSVFIASDSGYYIGGTSKSGISGDKSEACILDTIEDFWFLKLDQTGTIEWQKDLGGRYRDYLLSIHESGNQRVVIAGFSESDVSGDKTEASVSFSQDYWILSFTLPDAIWPGDANHDGTANNLDILAIGLAFGDHGPARTAATINWNAEYCDDWINSFAGGVNYKHADCNGDSFVYHNDTIAVALNYGLFHARSDAAAGSGAPFYLEFASDTFENGDTIQGDLIFGDLSDPLIDVYGLAFSISYDTSIVLPGSFKIQYLDSWFTALGNRLSFAKDLPAQDRMDGALSRTNQTNTGGYGPIATVSMVVQDNIDGKDFLMRNLNFEITNVTCIKVDESLVDVNPSNSMLTVTQEVLAIQDQPSFKVKCYPNPIGNQFAIYFEKAFFGSIQLYNIQGSLLSTLEVNGDKVLDLNSESLAEDCYFLQCISRDGEREIIKLRK